MSAGQLPAQYQFVAMGTQAPDPVPDGELWIDVGSRFGPGVLDHHGGDTDVWSASRLVVENPRLVSEALGGDRPPTLVTHVRPDLDAVTAAWLAQRIAACGRLTDADLVARIVDMVSANDQGAVRCREARRCWPVVMRTLLAHEWVRLTDGEIVARGARALDHTFERMVAGVDLDTCAELLMTPDVEMALAQAERVFGEDLSRSTVFTVRIPVRSGPRHVSAVPPGARPMPEPDLRGWALVRGLHLDDPRSVLFKELARGGAKAEESSPLLVVSRGIEMPTGGSPRWRHIISADPLSGLHLDGLGGMLETAEKASEAALGGTLAGGRERVDAGTGRHGLDVPSPWYDGRGHGFTIVDSPVVTVHDAEVSGSVLRPDEVTQVLWRYGDPARFVSVLEGEVALVAPVRLEVGWDLDWGAACATAPLYPELDEQITATRGFSRLHSRVCADAEPGGRDLEPFEEQLWRTGDERAVWVRRYRIADTVDNCRRLAEVLAGFRSAAMQPRLPTNLRVEDPDEVLHLVAIRVPSSSVALDDTRGPTAQIIQWLVAAEASSFTCRSAPNELDSQERVWTRDRSAVAVLGRQGVAVVSSQQMPIDPQEAFVRPGGMVPVAVIVAAQRSAISAVGRSFAELTGRSARVASNLVLRHQSELLRVEQELDFVHASDDVFGQRCYEALYRAQRVAEVRGQVERKLRSLAGQVAERRARFYQQLSFWLSFIVAPLALTAAFFSGIQMDREFASRYLTVLPASWEPAGWLLFLAIFAANLVWLGALWAIVTWWGREGGRPRSGDSQGERIRRGPWRRT